MLLVEAGWALVTLELPLRVEILKEIAVRCDNNFAEEQRKYNNFAEEQRNNFAEEHSPSV